MALLGLLLCLDVETSAVSSRSKLFEISNTWTTFEYQVVKYQSQSSSSIKRAQFRNELSIKLYQTARSLRQRDVINQPALGNGAGRSRHVTPRTLRHGPCRDLDCISPSLTIRLLPKNWQVCSVRIVVVVYSDTVWHENTVSWMAVGEGGERRDVRWGALSSLF